MEDLTRKRGFEIEECPSFAQKQRYSEIGGEITAKTVTRRHALTKFGAFIKKRKKKKRLVHSIRFVSKDLVILFSVFVSRT